MKGDGVSLVPLTTKGYLLVQRDEKIYVDLSNLGKSNSTHVCGGILWY